MATISFEVPDDDLRRWQQANESVREEWERVASPAWGIAERLDALAKIAALDYPLPPKVEVGDVITWGGKVESFTVVAVDGDYVWLRRPSGSDGGSVRDLRDLNGLEVVSKGSDQ